MTLVNNPNKIQVVVYKIVYTTTIIEPTKISEGLYIRSVYKIAKGQIVFLAWGSDNFNFVNAYGIKIIRK